jgi:hypothetical protein
MERARVSRALSERDGQRRYEQAPLMMSADGPFLLNVAAPTTDWTQ